MKRAAGYSALQIVLHWCVALLILGQFLLHDGIGHVWRRVARGMTAPDDPLVAQHIAGGLLILAFTLLRLVLHRRRGDLPPPPGSNPLEDLAARLVHLGLQLLLVGLALTGLLAWFGRIAAMAELHEALTTLLLILLGVHAGAALFHQFVRRDGLLWRMGRPG